MIILSIPANVADIPAVNDIDLIEIRLDFLDENAYPGFLSKLEPTSKTIITIRDESEGGKISIPAEKKLKLYKEYIMNWDCLVDFEYSLYIRQKQILPPNNLILSLHNFERFDYEEIKNFLDESSGVNCAYLKLAVNISTYSELTKLSQLLSKVEKPLLFAGLGKLGKLSRLLFKHLNAVGTYIGLDDILINPAQLSISEMRKYYLTEINEETMIGGLLGGEQIRYSLGLSYYNQYFREKGLNAVYLPFIAEDITDFWNWFNTFRTNARAYGLSITMPFKTEAAGLCNSSAPVNLIHFSRNGLLFSNSDQSALKKALFMLERFKINSILVYGSGAMAQLAIKLAPMFGTTFITCRDKDKENALCEKYSLQSGQISKVYDLVINCTPIGCNDTDIFTETGIKHPRMIIDFPYCEYKASLNLAGYESNHYVDGIQLWKWQAMPQLAVFLHNIKGED